MELVQYNSQINPLTGRRAKGCQAAAIPMAFGNSDLTAGSKVDLFLLGEELCFGISPPTVPHQPAGVWQEWDGITSAGLSLPPPSHGGYAGRDEGLDLSSVRDPFPECYGSHLARHCSALRAFWLKPVVF